MGEFVGDPFETLDLPLSHRVYAIFSAYLVALAFGRATPTLLAQLDMSTSTVELLQVPALAILVASIGSSIAAGVVLAPSKNRNKLIWFVKGLLAGPVAVMQLRNLEVLITREEEALQDMIRKQAQQGKP